MVWIRSWFLKPFLAFKSFMFRVHMCCPYLPVVILLSFTIIYHVYHQFRIIIASQPPKQIIYTTIYVTPRKNLQHFCFEASICLLESSPSTDALCDLLLAQLRDDAASNDDADRMAGASAWARLAALVYHYVPPRWGMWGRMEGRMEIQHFLWLDAGYIIIDSWCLFNKLGPKLFQHHPLVKSFNIENKIYDRYIHMSQLHSSSRNDI